MSAYSIKTKGADEQRLTLAQLRTLAAVEHPAYGELSDEDFRAEARSISFLAALNLERLTQLDDLDSLADTFTRYRHHDKTAKQEKMLLQEQSIFLLNEGHSPEHVMSASGQWARTLLAWASDERPITDEAAVAELDLLARRVTAEGERKKALAGKTEGNSKHEAYRRLEGTIKDKEAAYKDAYGQPPEPGDDPELDELWQQRDNFFL